MCEVCAVCNQLLFTRTGRNPTGLNQYEAQVDVVFSDVPSMDELNRGAIGTCKKPKNSKAQAFCAGCDGTNVQLMSESPSVAPKIGEANRAGMWDNNRCFGYISPPGQEIPTGFE